MAITDYDVITVGGGLGGASVAKVLAEKGLRVLVTEREETFEGYPRGPGAKGWPVRRNWVCFVQNVERSFGGPFDCRRSRRLLSYV